MDCDKVSLTTNNATDNVYDWLITFPALYFNTFANSNDHASWYNMGNQNTQIASGRPIHENGAPYNLLNVTRQRTPGYGMDDFTL